MFRLIYDDNGTSHEDLILQVGEFESRGDSYYFRLESDELPLDDLNGPLVKLLTTAMSRIANTSSPFFVPFGLFDQSSSWICFDRKGREVDVSLGWSSEPGHAVKIAIRETAPEDYEITPASVQLLKFDELSEDLARSMRMFDALRLPQTDPTPIFEHYRGMYGSQLLTAAVTQFRLFDQFRGTTDSISLHELQKRLQLMDRPFIVLTTALKAMGLLQEVDGCIAPTELAVEHLCRATDANIANYIGLSATSPDVLGMVERLKTNTPYGLETDDNGAAFIYRDGMRSAMEQSELARHFTLSLAGRARNVAPVLAGTYRLDDAKVLLDIGGGSGIYSIAYLARNPHLRAIVLDRPEVLSVAAEFAVKYGVENRLELLSGDMFADDLPEADVILLSNILHDWDIPECQQLVRKCAERLPSGGRLLIHDVFLNNDHSGPLPVALYSAALFSITEGRAYSVAEYTSWMNEVGLTVAGPIDTLIHCGVLCGTKA